MAKDQAGISFGRISPAPSNVEANADTFRLSLPALARELGTSHQLLRHYLIGLEEWQRQEGYRKANREAEEIRARVAAENREFEDWQCGRLQFKLAASAVDFPLPELSVVCVLSPLSFVIDAKDCPR